MAAEWYFRVVGTEFGPVSPTELVERAADGKIRPDTEVRKGEGAWVPASKVAGLFDRASQARVVMPNTIASAASRRGRQRIRSCTVSVWTNVKQSRSNRHG